MAIKIRSGGRGGARGGKHTKAGGRSKQKLPFRDMPVDASVVAGALQNAFGRAFLTANRNGQLARTDPFGLSMSRLGDCPRQNAYRLAGVPPTDSELGLDDEARAAQLGVMAHNFLLPLLAQALAGAAVEAPVELPVELPGGSVVTVDGRLDLYTSAFAGGVLDLKTLRAHALGDTAHHPTPAQHRDQVFGYAAAALRKGWHVAWVAWAYMDRSSGEIYIRVQPFGPDEFVEVETRVRSIAEGAMNPNSVSRGGRAPGLCWECDTCPWLQECWGNGAKPGDPTVLRTHDNTEIEEAAAEYMQLRDEKKAIDERMKYLRAVMGRPRSGRYGDSQIVYGKAFRRFSQAKAEALLDEFGVGVEEYTDWADGSMLVRRAVPLAVPSPRAPGVDHSDDDHEGAGGSGGEQGVAAEGAAQGDG